jgi:hypothetical protein
MADAGKTENTVAAEGQSPASAWQMAEEGWSDLAKAAAKIQAAANLIKKTDRSIDGYNIERSLQKHKPHLMAEHLINLRAFRQENKL